MEKKIFADVASVNGLCRGCSFAVVIYVPILAFSDPAVWSLEACSKGAPRVWFSAFKRQQLALVNRSHFLQFCVACLLAGGLGIQALETLSLMLSIKLLDCLRSR